MGLIGLIMVLMFDNGFDWFDGWGRGEGAWRSTVLVLIGFDWFDDWFDGWFDNGFDWFDGSQAENGAW